MKTKFHIPVLFILFIHAMIKGQTPANPAFEHHSEYVLGYAYYTDEERREFSAVQDPAELLLKAEELLKHATLLLNACSEHHGRERAWLKKEAAACIRKAELQKLAAAELTAYNNRMEFSICKASFMKQLKDHLASDTSVIRAKQLFLIALRSGRVAGELREEAYAQKNTDAVLANLYHAEETERIAFLELGEALNSLKKAGETVLASK